MKLVSGRKHRVPLRWTCTRLYGLYPIGDTTRSFTWKYHYNLETAKRWFGHLGGTDSEVGLQLRLQRFQAGLDKLFRLTNDPNAKLTEEVPPTKGHSEFSDFIDASETGMEKRLFLNVPNNGLFTQFPSDLTVELPIMVSKGGRMQPEKVDPFPKRLVDFVLTPRMLHMEWGLEAFKSGTARNAGGDPNQRPSDAVRKTSKRSDRCDPGPARKHCNGTALQVIFSLRKTMKITIVGAGSAVFWMSMIRDLTVMKSAPGSTISLVDINQGRLDAVYDLATRYAKEVGVDTSLRKDRKSTRCPKKRRFCNEHRPVRRPRIRGKDEADRGGPWLL